MDQQKILIFSINFYTSQKEKVQPSVVLVQIPFLCVLSVDTLQYKGTQPLNISQSNYWVKTIECHNNGESFVTSRLRNQLGKWCTVAPTQWVGPGRMNVTLTKHCLCLCLHYHRHFIMFWWHRPSFSNGLPWQIYDSLATLKRHMTGFGLDPVKISPRNFAFVQSLISTQYHFFTLSCSLSLCLLLS